MKRAWKLVVMTLFCGACAEDEPYGQLTLALGKGDYFKLKILREAPDAQLAGKVAFETSCDEAKSGSFELTNMPEGQGLWIVLESFGSSTCVADKRIDMGYRGGVTIGGTAKPHYHVPLYAVHAISPLPEDINISASQAIAVKYCESQAQCSDFGPTYGCYQDLPAGRAQPFYYCLPVCSADTECSGFHARAACVQGYCVLHQPFPLNMSEPRTFGVAAALSSGSVALVGGYGDTLDQRLVPTGRPVETFDADLGLFTQASLTGLEGWGAGFFGFAPLRDDRFAVAGGARAARPTHPAEAGVPFELNLEDLGKDFCAPNAACLPNPLESVYVLDFKSQSVTETSLPRGLIAPVVLPKADGSFVVAGGFAKEQGVLVRSRTAYVCTRASASLTCTELPSQLATGRAGAATACVNDLCDSFLVLGGNAEGALAELADLSTATPAFKQLSVTGLPAPIQWPTLCGLQLVGGAAPVGQSLAASGLAVAGAQLTGVPLAGTAVAPLLPSAVQVSTTSCWIGGGIAPDGTAVMTAYQLEGAAPGPTKPAFSKERFGMQAARIGSGPLSGAILFAGGLRLVKDDERVDLVRGAEVLWP